ncbi:MAG TPA: N-acetylmuramoyl-L-alanine amidase [Halothiobacillus sp.]|nr:N-acetylmuramoyl-L-alanine amidase [Halothiobacillus sp.]
MSSYDNESKLHARRRFLTQLVIGGGGLLLLPSWAVASQRLQAVRSSANKENSRFVFDLEAPLDYKVFTLDNPHRVVLDLARTQLVPGLTAPVPDGSVVQRVRFGVQNGYDLRVVLDVSGPVEPRVMLLPPEGTAGYRLVVDIPHRGIPVTAQAPAKPVPRSSTPAPQQSSAFRDLVIAIDAGHGGRDPGAIGPAGTREKDVVLAISRRLRDLVAAERGLRPVMIRDSDIFIPLRERTNIARRNGADLFISVHADAFHNRSARGASVYCLSLQGASSEAARWLAERENAADLVGGVSIAHQDELVASVLLDLAQTKTLENSLDLGERVLRQLGHVAHLHKSEVQQAGFVVLRSPDIPSILVESAFISNPAEERRLRTAAYQQQVAEAILKGIHSYYAARAPSGTRYAMA